MLIHPTLSTNYCSVSWICEQMEMAVPMTQTKNVESLGFPRYIYEGLVLQSDVHMIYWDIGLNICTIWYFATALRDVIFITLEPDDLRVHPRVLQGILQRLLVLLTIMDLMIREGGAKWCTSFMLVPPSSSLTTPSFHVWARGSEVSFTNTIMVTRIEALLCSKMTKFA